GAGAVARPGAGAVADEAVAAGADGAPAGAAAAGPDALQAVAPAARHLADLVADQAAVDVAVVDAGGEVSRTGQRGERPARGLLQEAEHTGLAGVLDRLLLGQLRRRVVVLHDVLAGLTGRLLLAHLALVERHLGAGAAGGLLVTGVHLLLFLLRVLLRLGLDAGEAPLAAEAIVVERLGVGRHRAEQRDEAEDDDRGAAEVGQNRGVGGGEQRGGVPARRRHRRDEEGLLPRADPEAGLVRDRHLHGSRRGGRRPRPALPSQ